jgi:galactokinase
MDVGCAHTREQLGGKFAERFGDAGGCACSLAPGRVNLIGEHTDYNGGFVLPVAIARHTAVVFRPGPRPRLRVHSATMAALGKQADDEFGLSAREMAPLGDPSLRWRDYVRGVAAALARRGIKLKGGDLLIDADLPLGAGLSSSASLEVACALALLSLARKKMPARQLALACQEAEHRHVGIRCGIMDQTIASRARQGHALLLDCRDLSVRQVPIKLRDWCFAVFDTGVRHELAAGEYNKRRAQCEHAARLLRAGSLREVSLEQLLARGRRLTVDEHRRVRHVLSEDLRVMSFTGALEHGDAQFLGRLLLDGHRSLRDDYQVSCAELDALVEAACSARSPAGPLCLGARMTGGGFGGAVVALIRAGQFETVRAHLAERYGAACGRRLGASLPVEPAGCARVVRL